MDSIRAIKKRFAIIIFGLSLLFVVNMLYLKGLYSEIAEETAGILHLAIEEADSEELQNRLAAISSSENGASSTISIIKSAENTIIFSRLMTEIKHTVHQTVDTMLPPNLPLLDSLIVANFKNRNLSIRVYYSEIVDLNTNAVTASSRITTAERGKNFRLYEYDTENGYAYKVYISSLTGAVLGRMSGILFTTLFTILLLGYAFWYFIRTMVRQKTLEEMKRDFTNNMTHELNTPISVAYSAVDTLLNFKQGENKEKSRQYLNICIEQLSRLRDLVEHILSMSMDKSKNIAVNKDNIELKPLFAQIAGQQKLKTAKCLDADIIVRPENLTVYADKTHFGNIFNNLMDNAIKYSSDNVKIEIQAYSDEKHCIVSIKDNGIGISRENQKHIFDRFYRVPQGNLHNVKGYGLGLFYVKTMVELHGGEITVKSVPDKGSEFIIKIPVR